ncbi:MAG: glycosyl transferase family 1 [Flavobacteriales bacterium]|nr:MAG: glycosyl transferase family 1 [Flavobacteriales bacterium]
MTTGKQKTQVLIVVMHRCNRSPSQRFRYEQYIPYLEEHGFEFTYSHLVNEQDDKYFYAKGFLLKKFLILIKSFILRAIDVVRASRYDIIFVQREAIMIGTSIFERLFSLSKAKLIYDFDDALWTLDTSSANKALEWLKNPYKIKRIMAAADLIIAGNEYLHQNAKKYNVNVIIIPTTINTAYHNKLQKPESKEKVCIGWTGSETTIKHFELAIPWLKKIKEKFGEKVYFKLIGDENYFCKELNLKGIAWSLESELSDLCEIDIGIMPLPSDEWANGKCGFKGLQYMAMKIPTVMSPVGVNKEIIQHGHNGFLADTEEEWIEITSRLINAKELRKSIGNEAREAVISRYSVEANQSKYLNAFSKLN